jgi:hypothetical protein
MIPFALLLSGGGVISGIRATTGARQVDITKLKIMTTPINVASDQVKGIREKATAHIGKPNRI